MTEGREGRAAFRLKSAELAVAALFFIAGAIVIYDSVRLGFGWQEVHGPQPGYFPFYIGLAMVIASIGTIVLTLMGRTASTGSFVERTQLRDVMKVLIPSVVFVAMIGVLGIYVSSVLFIGAFMRWLGRFPWTTIAAVSIRRRCIDDG